MINENQSKKIRNVTSCIAGFMLLSMEVQAECTVVGSIVRVLQYDEAYSSDGCTIYMKTRSISNFEDYYYYATTEDDSICSTAVAVLVNTVRVGMETDADSCPTTGIRRNAGAVNFLEVNP